MRVVVVVTALVLTGAGGTALAQLRQPVRPPAPIATVNPQTLFSAQAGAPVNTIVNDSVRAGYLNLDSGASVGMQTATSDIQARGVDWTPLNGARIAQSMRAPQAPVTSSDCASLQYSTAGIVIRVGQSFCVITGAGHLREISVTGIAPPPPQSTNHTSTVTFDLSQWP